MQHLVNFFFVLTVLISTDVIAQTQSDTRFVLEGTVYDDRSQPIPFANVALYADSQVVTGGTTGFDGEFKINVLAKSVDRISKIRISSVGFIAFEDSINLVAYNPKRFILQTGDFMEEVIVRPQTFICRTGKRDTTGLKKRNAEIELRNKYPFYWLKGTVLDSASKEPIESAILRFGAKGGRLMFNWLTAKNGVYSYRIPSSEMRNVYEIKIEKEGFKTDIILLGEANFKDSVVTTNFHLTAEKGLK
ncbi:MAG: hypothetical protein ACI9YU_000809 [Flavobacteriales bacterium]|jgi:hypothetical protein